MLGVPIFSRKHATIAPDEYHLAQIIKFTGEEFPPGLIKKYKLAPQFFDMKTGESALHIYCNECFDMYTYRLASPFHQATFERSVNPSSQSTTLCSSDTMPRFSGFLRMMSRVQSILCLAAYE
jgi:hypothetical protein